MDGVIEGFVVWGDEPGGEHERLTLLVRMDDSDFNAIPPGLYTREDGVDCVNWPRVSLTMGDPETPDLPDFGTYFCLNTAGHTIGDEAAEFLRED